jgi:hypothetical protein
MVKVDEMVDERWKVEPRERCIIVSLLAVGAVGRRCSMRCSMQCTGMVCLRVNNFESAGRAFKKGMYVIHGFVPNLAKTVPARR